MSCYIDTSALVAALVIEPHSMRVRPWLARQPIGSVFVSEWTYPEITSALSLKLRTRQLTIDRALHLEPTAGGQPAPAGGHFRTFRGRRHFRQPA